jgi:hypothetical protein
VLYHNNGDGTFSDKTRDSGLYRTDGNGLGVVFDDYDNDGWIDIYVANDSVPNFLFHNQGKGIFEEVGFRAGVAVGHNGKPLAGMGTDTGDIDGDGLVDVIVTNLAGEAHTLYRNLGKGLFEDATFQSGVGRATLPFVGFGVVFFDFDNDTDLDLGIANGDVIDNVRMVRDNAAYEQPTLLLQNDGSGKFRDITAQAGPGFSLHKPHRGFAAADMDHDGDLDLLIGTVGQTPTLLRNNGGNRFNALMVRTIGTRSNRDGIGARLTLTAGNSRLLRTIKSGSSYLAQNEMRAHFGLGSATRATRLEIRWPSGVVDVLENIEANRSITIREGQGLIETANFVQ